MGGCASVAASTVQQQHQSDLAPSSRPSAAAVQDQERSAQHSPCGWPGIAVRRSTAGAPSHTAPILLPPANQPCVLFIFGGPQSNKGAVVQHLTTAHGFRLINCEQLLIARLRQICAQEKSNANNTRSSGSAPSPANQDLAPRKSELGDRSSPSSRTSRIRPSLLFPIRQRQSQTRRSLRVSMNSLRQHIKEHGHELSITLALQLVSVALRATRAQRIIVDLVPNIPMLARLPGFARDNAVHLRSWLDKQNFSCCMALTLTSTTLEHCHNGRPSTLADEGDGKRLLQRSRALAEAAQPFIDIFAGGGALYELDATHATATSWRLLFQTSQESRPCVSSETDGRNGESTLPPPLPSKGNNLAETKQACVLLGHTATLEKLAPALGVQFRLQNAGEKMPAIVDGKECKFQLVNVDALPPPETLPKIAANLLFSYPQRAVVNGREVDFDTAKLHAVARLGQPQRIIIARTDEIRLEHLQAWTEQLARIV